jgi:ABC-2 type transport system permease protein
VGGQQFLPRLMGDNLLGTWDPAGRWWIYLVPPAWFAAPFELLAGTVDWTRVILTGLGVVVPLGVVRLALLLAPGFKEALARLEEAPRAAASGPATRGRWCEVLARWLARRPIERGAFEFLWTLAGRDRQFKLRTYPNVVFVLVMGAGIILAPAHKFEHGLDTLRETRTYLFLLYMCCALAPTALLQLRYSDQWEAAWLYRVAPLATPGLVLRAGLKMVIVKLVLPSLALVSVATLLLWGRRVVPDLVLAACATLLICAVQARLMARFIPFSEPYAMVESSGRVGRMMLYMLLSAGLGGLHYALTFVPYGVLAAIPILALLAWLALRAYGRTTWRQVMAEVRPKPTTRPL